MHDMGGVTTYSRIFGMSRKDTLEKLVRCFRFQCFCGHGYISFGDYP